MHRRFVIGGLVWAVAVLGGGVAAAAVGVDDGDDPAAPWVEAMVEDAREDEDLDLPTEVAECFAGAIVDTVTVAQLEAEDVSPRDLVRADSLADLDLELDDAAAAGLAEAALACGFGAAVAEASANGMVEGLASEVDVELDDGQLDSGAGCVTEALIADGRVVQASVDGYIEGLDAIEGRGPEIETAMLDALTGCPEVIAGFLYLGLESMGMPLGDEARACVDAHLADDGGALRASFAEAMASGDGEAAGAAWMGGVILTCPQIMVDGMVAELEAAGMPPGPSGRACIAAEVAARPDVLAAVVSDPAGSAGEEFGMAIGAACFAQFDG